METFAVDRTLYDIGEGDLQELWDTELDPSMSDAFRSTEPDSEWINLLDAKPPVILHDRLMTDAALGTVPIKSDHSYSLTSDGDSAPNSPISLDRDLDDDMESECFPAIPMNTAAGNRGSRDSLVMVKKERSSPVAVKQEPLTPVVVKQEPPSTPPSPEPGSLAPGICIKQEPDVHLKHDSRTANIKCTAQQSLLKQPTILLATRTGIMSHHNRVVFPKLNIKLEPTNCFSLPPTPPSSSDSEGSLSPIHHPSSPLNGNVTSTLMSSVSLRQQQTSSRLISTSTPLRQPIQTPLISSQPKGSSGLLFLTEEEKRTLISEGYPIPVRLPLTKLEEKSLKKIRRKIKNKISAQESRRKKKEYMDALEKKVEHLQHENSEYKKKIENLESTNSTLMSQLQKLQAVMGESPCKVSRTATTQTASATLMVSRAKGSFAGSNKECSEAVVLSSCENMISES